ncbi:MAG: hypothetical protein JW840_07270 [Candidatus Thermoplasmatota archaeon]|nr:hypothetical protein [Candidatus Thermoplasmatota archaeon]
MKKKGKTTKKTPKKSSKINAQHTEKAEKVIVGEDEFCPTCMEWRTFDEITGKCTVCGRVIKKVGERRKITDEYDLKDFVGEHDEPQESGEF